MKKKSVKAAFAIILVAAVIGLAVVIGGKSDMFKTVKTVGKNISSVDVTDFYYTVDSTTNPPHFQRYRFFVEDGKYMFYHEKREGNSLPLTESDITVSGKKELSDEEWAEFFNCIDGGKVVKREESTQTGGSGPWLYIYWKGDRSVYQQFSFESYGKQTEFEELCKRLAE